MSEAAWMPSLRREFAEAGREKRQQMLAPYPTAAQMRVELALLEAHYRAQWEAYLRHLMSTS